MAESDQKSRGAHETSRHITSNVLSDLDILYGNGDRSIKHIGNMSFRTLIGCCGDEYKTIDKKKRSKKTSFLRSIVAAILKSGGRFLREKKGCREEWELVSPREAANKISQEFRDTARKPHILSNYSLVQNLDGFGDCFRSAHDFDWGGIVRFHQGKLFKPEQSVMTPDEGETTRSMAHIDGSYDDATEVEKICQDFSSSGDQRGRLDIVPCLDIGLAAQPLRSGKPPDELEMNKSMTAAKGSYGDKTAVREQLEELPGSSQKGCQDRVQFLDSERTAQTWQSGKPSDEDEMMIRTTGADGSYDDATAVRELYQDWFFGSKQTDGSFDDNSHHSFSSQGSCMLNLFDFSLHGSEFDGSTAKLEAVG